MWYPIRHIRTEKCCKKWSTVLHIYLGTSETEYRVSNKSVTLKLENIVKKWRKALVNYLNFCAIYYVFANFSWCASIQMVAGKTTWPNFDLFKNFNNTYTYNIFLHFHLTKNTYRVYTNLNDFWFSMCHSILQVLSKTYCLFIFIIITITHSLFMKKMIYWIIIIFIAYLNFQKFNLKCNLNCRSELLK